MRNTTATFRHISVPACGFAVFFLLCFTGIGCMSLHSKSEEAIRGEAESNAKGLSKLKDVTSIINEMEANHYECYKSFKDGKVCEIACRRFHNERSLVTTIEMIKLHIENEVVCSYEISLQYKGM